MDIDTICKMTTNPEMLNALHACRKGHPLNHPNAFRDAVFLAKQRPSYEISYEAIGWLTLQISKPGS